MVTLAPERAGGPRRSAGSSTPGGGGGRAHRGDLRTDPGRRRRGATVGTHLFNAMRLIHHREPGPVIALVEDPRVTVEVIADGVHVDGALYRHVSRSVGPDRLSLVTDAMAAAGMSDGAYRIGPLAVEVSDGVAHLAGTDTIAGSTATMDRLFRFAGAQRVATGCGPAVGRSAVLDQSRTRSWAWTWNCARRHGRPRRARRRPRRLRGDAAREVGSGKHPDA